MDKHLTEFKNRRSKPPRFEVVDNKLAPETRTMSQKAWNADLAEALGVQDHSLASLMLTQVMSAISKVKQGDCQLINATIAQIAEIAPRDQTESMLALQMITCHTQVMNLMQQITKASSYIDTRSIEVALRLADKLMCTYTKQMEALTKYRRNGSQKIVVEHVTVEAGGQAIVGNIKQGDGAR